MPGYCILLLFLVVICTPYKDIAFHDDVHMQHVAPISKLHELVLGEVLPCCVNNRACIAIPAVMVRPPTTEDVAIVVNFARRIGIQVALLGFKLIGIIRPNTIF